MTIGATSGIGNLPFIQKVNGIDPFSGGARARRVAGENQTPENFFINGISNGGNPVASVEGGSHGYNGPELANKPCFHITWA